MKYLILVFAFMISAQSFGQSSTNHSQMKQLQPRAGATVGSKYSLIGKIKSCLAAVYATQAAYHAERGTYISSSHEFVSDTATSCAEIDVTTEVANRNEFRVIAKSGSEAWSVDQNKEITQLR